MQIENLSLDAVKPYEKNARTHPKRQIELLVDNIQRFGFTTPLLVDKHNNLIAGHGRLEAVKQLGWTEVPVVRLESLNAKEVKALRLADNQLAQISEWDMDLVLEELKDLESDLQSLTGFDLDLLVEETPEDDVVPGTPSEPKSKKGDLYELGGHRVMCGDSLDLDVIEAVMNGQKARMVFTDPPYNVNYGATMKDKLRGTDNRKILNDSFKDKQAFYQFLYDAISSLRPFVVGDVYIAMSSSELHTLQKAFEDCGGHWSTFIIWVKNTFTIGRSNYQRQYEPILYGWFEGSSHYWSGARNLGDVVKSQVKELEDGTLWVQVKPDEQAIGTDIWEVDKPRANKEHPTMKPISLMTRAILNSSERGDIVLDSFLGSGSTLIACEKTGRRCYGTELDPKFADVIVQRWVDFTGNTTVIRNGQEEQWQLSPGVIGSSSTN